MCEYLNYLVEPGVFYVQEESDDIDSLPICREFLEVDGYYVIKCGLGEMLLCSIYARLKQDGKLDLLKSTLLIYYNECNYNMYACSDAASIIIGDYVEEVLYAGKGYNTSLLKEVLEKVCGWRFTRIKMRRSITRIANISIPKIIMFE